MKKSTADGRGEALSILLDTGYLVAHYSREDPHHARARELMEEILDAKHGVPLVSDYIVLELLNYASSSRGARARMSQIPTHLLAKGSAQWVVVINVDERTFEAALELYTRLGLDRGLSFTDCSSVALAKAHGIDAIASFDRDFDGILARVS